MDKSSQSALSLLTAWGFALTLSMSSQPATDHGKISFSVQAEDCTVALAPRIAGAIELYTSTKPETIATFCSADTTPQAADDFCPGYAHTFTEIGTERGGPATTRAQFDAAHGARKPIA
jgi:hypothetical protein